MNELGTLQLPPQASTIAGDVDSLYYFIFWGCMAFFVLIVALCAFFVMKYRRRSEDEIGSGPSHNTPLEVTWTVVPLVLVMVVFFWGFRSYMEMHTAPAGALEYYVTGKQWLWQVNHPTGAVEVNNMYVPVDEPVKVILQSEDVIHSFYVPAFRVKMDAYPNQYTTLWFEATRTGDYDLFCAEYCGEQHSQMKGKVHVLSRKDYDAWVASTSGPKEGEDLTVWGEKMYTKNACVTCHSLDGSKRTGPTFKGIWGTDVTLSDGTTVVVDENYVRSSILDPHGRSSPATRRSCRPSPGS